MKILFVTPINATTKFGGAIRILEIINQVSKKHEVILVSMGLPDVATTILNENVRLIQVPAYIFKTPFVGLRYLVPLTKKYKPDIIQAEMVNVAYLCGIAGKMTGTPTIFDVHGDTVAGLKFYKTIFYPYKLLFYPFAYKTALNMASCILVVSEKQKDLFIERDRIDPGKIFIIPNGFTSENLRLSQNAIRKVGYEGTTLCFVGSLPKWAKVDMLIESFKQVLDERKEKNLSLFIVGDGPERRNLEDLTHQYRIQDRVIFTGRVQYSEVKDYLHSSDILLAPFPKDLVLEVACPMKLLEYSYIGKPIVTTNVGDVPKMLKRNNAAIVTKPTVEAFAQGILKAIDDERLRKTLSGNAKKFSEEYTWDKVCDNLFKIYSLIEQ